LAILPPQISGFVDSPPKPANRIVKRMLALRFSRSARAEIAVAKPDFAGFREAGKACDLRG
jgi:hypothetical protein